MKSAKGDVNTELLDRCQCSLFCICI